MRNVMIPRQSERVNSIAFSRKRNGELLVCLDLKQLDAAIKRTYHSAPTLDEIRHKLHSAKVFSKLDAKHGHWGIKLDEDSGELCTFNSPQGKYTFKRLPFGLLVSQDIFQKHTDDIIRCVGHSIIGIADDFVWIHPGRTRRCPVATDESCQAKWRKVFRG